MRRGVSRRLARFADAEDEGVVYYDLDADAVSRNPLLSLDAISTPAQPRAPSTAAAEGSKQIFARQQRPLFNLDDSGDEAEQEEENPFASLLQQQQTTEAVEDEETLIRGKSHGNSLFQTEGESKEDKRQRPAGNSSRGVHRSILKRSQPPTGTRITTAGKKKLGFEAADSRPSRWSTTKPSAADTNNRRKSLSAIQQRRSQLEAASAKRRKSMPPTQSSSQPTHSEYRIDDSVVSSSALPKKRLLSDVLERATILSQQLNSSHDESAILPTQTEENPVDADAILDTEHQMRSEEFAPQIFSPTKPPSASSTMGRKLKADGIAPKIRGSIGDVIRKAIRKSNRDLTLLRSQGQHLLQHTSHSPTTRTTGAMEYIQDRAHILICLKKSRGVTPYFASYECRVHEVAVKLKEKTASMIKENRSIVLEALFQPQTAQYLKLAAGTMVKVYEPLHFVADEVATGSTSNPKWFLLCTQLAEVIDHHHCCAGSDE